jgi:hypothetical protein
MSFDLAVMYLEKPIRLKEGAEIYAELCDGNNDVLRHSSRIDSFYRDLIYKYPEIDSYSDDEVDDCPWSVSLDIYGGAVLMSIVWSRVEEVQSFIRELAAKHDLVCFDPQNDELYLPPALS